jgi:choline kinase
MIVNILAAGRGSRLNELTDLNPKCIVNFRGKSLIEWNLSTIQSVFPKDKIWIVTGYQSKVLGNYSNNLIHNSNWERNNIGSSILTAFEINLTNDCLFIYSDIYFKKEALLEISVSTESSVVSVENWKDIWNLRFKNPTSDLESFAVDEKGYIVDIGQRKPNFQDIEGQFSGIFLIKRSDWDIFRKLTQISDEEIRSMDTTQIISRMIVAGIKFKNIKYFGEWVEVDTLNDLLIFENLSNEL